MASNAPSDGITRDTHHRHGAHDSGCDTVKEECDTARVRIRELEEENHLLAERATAAAQKFVDYENELRVLREQLRQQHERHSSTTSNKSDPDHHAPTPAAASVERPGISRFGSFMRKASLATNDGVRDQVLEAALVKEQTARIAAETKIRQMSAEVEDLSTTLFQQANEMVATERRENALLREKIRELEGASGQGDEGIAKENERLIQKLHALEQRDAARVQRLERLEAAQNRIDRVRTMLEQR